MEAAARSVQIEFPHFAAALLETLNKHRLEGKFCDIAVHVQGRVFHAHKSVLAAASPYFHDKLLLQDTSCLALPSVIEPDTFENLLQLIYSGRLKLLVEALPSHLLVASGLQMWQVVDQCSAILKELEGGPYRPWSSRASENQSPSSSNYFAVKEDGELGGSGERGMVAAARGVPGCPDDEVMKIRVSHEEEEEEEEDKHPAGICSGSLDKSMKIVLKDDEEVGLGVSKGPASAEPDGPFPSPRDHPKIYYIKQERFDPEEAAVAALGSGAGAVGEACFLKSLAQGRALGIAEVHGLYQASLQPGSGSEVSYIIPAAGSAATTAIASSSSSSLAAPGFTIKAQPLPSDEVGFPQSSWKPVDLHGNEIIAHTVHGQVVHAPVKIVAAPDGKKFGCLCGKRFAVKPKRDRHIMLTFSLRPFGCSVCNKKFKLKHHLTEHMKTHDGNLYSCEDCGRKFRVQNCFLKHKELCKGQGWATACWTYK